MMNKIFATVFAGMTAVAGFSTATNVGVQDPAFERLTGPPSVRTGSARSGLRHFGGSRGGK
jgi:hypothetical protein